MDGAKHEICYERELNKVLWTWKAESTCDVKGFTELVAFWIKFDRHKIPIAFQSPSIFLRHQRQCESFPISLNSCNSRWLKREPWLNTMCVHGVGGMEKCNLIGYLQMQSIDTFAISSISMTSNRYIYIKDHLACFISPDCSELLVLQRQ
jgi:hypothetical protein